MRRSHEHVVPGGFGHGFAARAGQHVTIIDLAGQQAGDFVALSRADMSEVLSPVHTRRENLSIFLRVGDQLFSSRSQPMFTVVADDLPP